MYRHPDKLDKEVEDLVSARHLDEWEPLNEPEEEPVLQDRAPRVDGASTPSFGVNRIEYMDAQSCDVLGPCLLLEDPHCG